jgi:hypothetical protein
MKKLMILVSLVLSAHVMAATHTYKVEQQLVDELCHLKQNNSDRVDFLKDPVAAECFAPSLSKDVYGGYYAGDNTRGNTFEGDELGFYYRYATETVGTPRFERVKIWIDGRVVFDKLMVAVYAAERDGKTMYRPNSGVFRLKLKDGLWNGH